MEQSSLKFLRYLVHCKKASKAQRKTCNWLRLEKVKVWNFGQIIVWKIVSRSDRDIKMKIRQMGNKKERTIHLPNTTAKETLVVSFFAYSLFLCTNCWHSMPSCFSHARWWTVHLTVHRIAFTSAPLCSCDWVILQVDTYLNPDKYVSGTVKLWFASGCPWQKLKENKCLLQIMLKLCLVFIRSKNEGNLIEN